MRIDASQTDDPALLASEVRRLAAALDDATAEVTRLRDEVQRLRAATTNHDAAPAAIAAADRERTDNPPARPGDGTGNTATLAAGARPENREGGSGDRQPSHSSPASAVTNDRPAPTAVTLTDAEREALEDGIRSVEYLAARGFGTRAKLVATATNLWSLLARLGGER